MSGVIIPIGRRGCPLNKAVVWAAVPLCRWNCWAARRQVAQQPLPANFCGRDAHEKISAAFTRTNPSAAHGKILQLPALARLRAHVAFRRPFGFFQFDKICFARSKTSFGTPASRATWMRSSCPLPPRRFCGGIQSGHRHFAHSDVEVFQSRHAPRFRQFRDSAWRTKVFSQGIVQMARLMDQPRLKPSTCSLPRPISSSTMRLRAVALFKMFAVSVISTMNVDCPRDKSSLAPMRVKNAVHQNQCAAFRRRHETAGVRQKREQRTCRM